MAPLLTRPAAQSFARPQRSVLVVRAVASGSGNSANKYKGWRSQIEAPSERAPSTNGWRSQIEAVGSERTVSTNGHAGPDAAPNVSVMDTFNLQIGAYIKQAANASTLEKINKGIAFEMKKAAQKRSR